MAFMPHCLTFYYLYAINVSLVVNDILLIQAINDGEE